MDLLAVIDIPTHLTPRTISDMRLPSTLGCLIASVTIAATASVATPNYKADVPEALITPDMVQSEYLGKLEFFDGFSW